MASLALPTVPPGPRGGLLGVLPRVQADSIRFLEETTWYGDILKYRIAFWPVYRVSHPDYARHILQDNHRNYDKRSIDYDMLRRVSGNGLISNQGESWLHQRRLMQPVFHRRRIAALAETMTAATLDMLANWERDGIGSRPFDIAEAMTDLTLDIVSRALFSLDIGDTGKAFSEAFNQVNEYLGSFDPLFAFTDQLPTPGMRTYREAMATLDGIIYDIIAARRARPSDDNDDLLALLMAAEDADTGERMDDQQLRDETITLLIAGHETTANTLSWVWYLLGKHPQVQVDLQAELTQALGGRVPTMDDLADLTLTNQILKEAMRLYPPAWFISRTAIEPDVIGGYEIPSDSLVSISTYLIHRHPDFWRYPTQFRPQRFTAEAEKQRPRMAYLPFGGGPRMCIGNHFAMTEAALILALVAQRYRFTLASGRDPQPEALITLRPKGGVWVSAEATR